MLQRSLRIDITLYLASRGEQGAWIWDIERAFPSRRVRTSIRALVDGGLVRVENQAVGSPTPRYRYFRTGKPLGPQQKLEVFVEVPA